MKGMGCKEDSRYELVLKETVKICVLAVVALLGVSCAAGVQTASQENNASGSVQSSSRRMSNQCDNTGCKTVITETLQAALEHDQEYTNMCQSIASELSGSKCTSTSRGIGPAASIGSTAAATQCVFIFPGPEEGQEVEKTVTLGGSVSGSGIDVSSLCSKTGVSCQVTDNSCSGSVDIKIIDKAANALNAAQIAQICHAYIQPGPVLPLKFSCSYGKTAESQAGVVSGTFAEIQNNPTANTGAESSDN